MRHMFSSIPAVATTTPGSCTSITSPGAIGFRSLARSRCAPPSQVKSNSQRVIGRSTHSLDTPVWSSFGGGGEKLQQ